MNLARIFTSLALFFTPSLKADFFEWTGNESRHWGDGSNWKTGTGYPGRFRDTDDAFMGNGRQNTDLENNTYTIADLEIDMTEGTRRFYDGKLIIKRPENQIESILKVRIAGDASNPQFDCDLEFPSILTSLRMAGAGADFSGVVSGSGAVTIFGGTVSLNNGANTFNGEFGASGNSAVIKLGHADALRHASVRLLFSGTLDLNGFSATIGGLRGTEDLSIGSNNLTLGGRNINELYEGILSGSGTVTKIGSGAWTLEGAHPLTGPTIINNGSIILKNTHALPHSVVTLNSTNGLSLSTNAEIGGLSGGANTALGAKILTIIPASGSHTYTGSFTGTGSSLIKSGAGSQFLKGNNSGLTGTTRINGGALYVDNDFSGNASSSGTGSSEVTVESGGTLGGSGRIGGVVTVNTGGVLSPGDNLGPFSAYQTLTLGSLTLEGSLATGINGDIHDRVHSEGDLTISNGILTLPNANLSADAYIIASYEGSLSGTFASIPSFPSGYRLDYAYHDGSSSKNIAIIKDQTSPLVSSISTPSTGTSMLFDITFDEDVVGFGTEDILLQRSSGVTATVSNVTGSGSSYQVLVTGVSGIGTLELSLNTGSGVQDLVGNNLANSAANTSGTITIDSVPPTASLSTSESSPTNSGTLTYTVTFSEAVTNFDSFDDLALATTGTASVTGASISGSGYSYTLTLTGLSGEGSLTVGIGTGGATTIIDTVGNAYSTTGSTSSFAITLDDVAPTASLSTSESSPTNNDTLTYTVTFSEAVTNFDNFDDLALSRTGTANASGANISGSGNTYTLTLTGLSGEGSLTVGIGTSGATMIIDTAGNAFTTTGSTTSSAITLDRVAPTARFSAPDYTLGGDSSVSFTVTFSEAVTGFDHFDDLVLSTTGTANAAGASISGSGNTYSLTLTGITGEGTLAVGVGTSGTSKIIDTLGNAFTTTGSTTSSTLSIDLVPPTASISTEETSPTNSYTLIYTVTFSETVLNFDHFNDLVLSTTGTASATGATISGQDGPYSSTYTLTLTGISGHGTLTVGIGAGGSPKIIDTSANEFSTEGSTTSPPITIDRVAPTTSISTSESSPSNSDSLTYTVTFSEAVTGFDDFNDLTLTTTDTANATGANISGSGSTYTLTLTGVSGEGSLTVGIGTGGASTIVDAAGNAFTTTGSTTSPAVSIDRIGPSVLSIATDTVSPSNTTELIYSVIFSEPVEDFDTAADLTITNPGNISYSSIDFETADNTTFTLTLRNISGDGNLSLAVKTNSGVTDTAGNALTSSPTHGPTLIDQTAPVITLNGPIRVRHTGGTPWVDEGVTVDTGETPVIGGDTVDIHRSGEYSITYDVTDAAGNQAEQKTRIVAVNLNYYVDDDAPGGEGTSWATAFTHLQDALSTAVPGDHIYIAEGTYYPDLGNGQIDDDITSVFHFPSGVGITGGLPFNGAPEDQDLTAYPTRLSGDLQQNDTPNFGNRSDNATHIVRMEFSESGTYDGLIIYGATENALSFHQSLFVLFRNCQFIENQSSSPAGIVDSINSFVTFEDCQFIGNHSQNGATLTADQGAVYFERCHFTQNTAAQNNILSFEGGANSNMISSVLTGNLSGSGSIISLKEASMVELTNITIQGNSAATSTLETSTDSDSLTIENSIIWNNQAAGSTTSTAATLTADASTALRVSYSLLENFSDATLNATGGSNNLDGTDSAKAPQFSTALAPSTAPHSGGDLHLKWASPLIDAGNDALHRSDLDLDRNERVQMIRIDLGAYEFQESDIPITATLVWSSEATSPTNGDLNSVFGILFSGPVQNFDITDLEFTTDGDLTLGSGFVILSEDPTHFAFRPADGFSGNGNLNVTLASDHDIIGADGRPVIVANTLNDLYIDTEAPVITLANPAPQNYPQGVSPLTVDANLSATATDNHDETVDVITSDDNLDVNVPGSYNITFTATDSAGNQTTKTTTVTIHETGFQVWAANHGLSGEDALPTADPDEDGRINLQEFALNGDPNSSASDGKIRVRFMQLGEQDYLSITLPVLSGTGFEEDTMQLGLHFGAGFIARYVIQGSTDLVTYQEYVDLVTPALDTGLPTLDDGWEYRSFRLREPASNMSGGFLRVGVSID